MDTNQIAPVFILVGMIAGVLLGRIVGSIPIGAGLGSLGGVGIVIALMIWERSKPPR